MRHATTSSKKKAVRFDSLEQEVYLHLWRTYDRLRQHEEELFSGYGLTAQQYNVLRLLRGSHPETLPTLELARRLVSRAPDITRILDKLEQMEVIARERRADNRRIVRVGLTNNGTALLDRLAEPLRECHQRQLGHLSAGRLKELRDLLREARGPHEEEGGVWS